MNAYRMETLPLARLLVRGVHRALRLLDLVGVRGPALRSARRGDEHLPRASDGQRRHETQHALLVRDQSVDIDLLPVRVDESLHDADESRLAVGPNREI